MGRHGSFFLGQDGEWKIRCDENLDVLLDPDDESSLIYPIFETCPGRPEKQPKCIKGFTIVDEQGIRYVFGGENEYDLDYIEFSIPLFRTSEGDQYTEWTANSWYLKRVEDRFRNTLYKFNYERGKFLIEARNDYEYRRITGHDFDTFYTSYFSVPSSSSLFPYAFQIVSPVYMTDITMPDSQRVEFVIDKTIELSSHDLYTGLYRIGDLYNKLRERTFVGNNFNLKPFYYLQTDSSAFAIYQKANPYKMADPLASMSLSPLKCINLKSSGTTYQAFYFRYGLANTSRFHIKEIDIYDDVANYQIALGHSMCYKFRYKDVDLLSKDCLTTAIDHWGYYNAYNSGNGYDTNGIGGTTGQQFLTYRNVNTMASQYGMLTDIIYPTGSCTSLEYEQNDFSSYQSDDRAEMRDSIGFAGGLRIKSITEYEDSTKIRMNGKRTYSYKASSISNDSSGELFSRPKYEWKNWHTYFNSHDYLRIEYVTSNSIIPLSNTFGPHIGYSRVKETNADGTSTVYVFTNISACMDEPFDLCFSSLPSPFDAYSEHGYKRGRLESKTVMAADGTVMKSEEYHYDEPQTGTSFCWTSNLRQPPLFKFTSDIVLYTGGVYKLYYPRYDVVSKVTTIYHDGANVVDSTAYTYSDQTFTSQNGYQHQASVRKLTSTKTFRAGESIQKQYTFKMDTASKNKYFFPLTSTTTRHNNKFIEKKETAYTLRNGQYVPSHEIVSTATSGINDTIVTYCDYDATYRLTRYTDKDGVPVQLFWDDNDRMVARVRTQESNVSFNHLTTNPLQVLTISGQSVFARKDTEAEVYMYNGRGLMKSKTFGNGQTEYYSYDSMNRLSEVRDTNNKVVQRYVYKYKTDSRDTQ